MNPPAYTATDIFSAAAAVHAAGIAAERAGVEHIVALSSVGAQHAEGTGNILTTHDLEQRLARARFATTILRAANFMENWAWSMHEAAETGVLLSMFAPVDKALPIVPVADIGQAAAELLLQGLSGPGFGRNARPARLLGGYPVAAPRQAGPSGRFARGRMGQGFASKRILTIREGGVLRDVSRVQQWAGRLRWQRYDAARQHNAR